MQIISNLAVANPNRAAGSGLFVERDKLPAVEQLHGKDTQDKSSISDVSVRLVDESASIQKPENEDQVLDPDRNGQKNEISEKSRQEELEFQIRELSQRDREVRNHERIHASLAGAHGGSPSFQFQRGPDGVLYAVTGSVSIDLSEVSGNPEATLRKAKQIERAALGPSDPSGADRAVASNARGLALKAQAEIAQGSSTENLFTENLSTQDKDDPNHLLGKP